MTSDVRRGPDGKNRCAWVGDDAEYRRYHDEEWGRELRGDRALFEKLSLEGFQAGLSWITILRRRPTFRTAFASFEPETVAAFTGDDVERLMADTGIIRNRAKILATIGNARLVAEMTRDDPGAFDRFMWAHAPESPHPRPEILADVPAVTADAQRLSASLKAVGFRFVGPTTMYALMQSTGMVDDHVTSCWRAV